MIVEMDNSMGKDLKAYHIRLNIAVCCIPIITIGAAFYLIFKGVFGIISLIFFILLMTSLMLFIYVQVSFFRPIKATIQEDSVLFEYVRLLKPRMVTWPEVRHLSVRPGDPSIRNGKYSRGGTLIDLRWRNYRLRYEVASAIRDAYREAMGHDPPIDEHWGS